MFYILKAKIKEQIEKEDMSVDNCFGLNFIPVNN